MQSETKPADKVVAAFLTIRPLYEKLVEEMCFALRKRMEAKQAKFVSISGRAKEISSFREKIERKQSKDPLHDLTDLAGVRIVCNYESELDDATAVIRSELEIHEEIDKVQALGAERMGYTGRHFIVSLGKRYSGARYDQIAELKCEIQVRTILQDAWALISHNLVYKNESTVPQPLRRALNNVASLLEIAQGVFDTVKEKRAAYQIEIAQREPDKAAFLAQSVDFETLLAYTRWKFPDLPTSEPWNDRLGRDLDLTAYRTLADVDLAVERAQAAVAAYRKEKPELFKTGTDFITKSLGFTDPAFRQKHVFAKQTLDAFAKYKGLVAPSKQK